jgi:hypothetical protein
MIQTFDDMVDAVAHEQRREEIRIKFSFSVQGRKHGYVTGKYSAALWIAIAKALAPERPITPFTRVSFMDGRVVYER